MTRGGLDDANSVAPIQRALELSVTFIDTPDVYGDGRGERLVAELIGTRARQDLVVSTKGGLMGHHRDPAQEPLRPAGESHASFRGSCEDGT